MIETNNVHRRISLENIGFEGPIVIHAKAEQIFGLTEGHFIDDVSAIVRTPQADQVAGERRLIFEKAVRPTDILALIAGNRARAFTLHVHLSKMRVHIRQAIGLNWHVFCRSA